MSKSANKNTKKSESSLKERPKSFYQKQKDTGLKPKRAYVHPDWEEFFDKNKKKWSQPRLIKKK